MPHYTITISNVEADSAIEAIKHIIENSDKIQYDVEESDSHFMEWLKDNFWMCLSSGLLAYIIWINM